MSRDGNTTQKDGAESDPKGFEAALERLEAIVGDMEGKSLGLEDMIARFEEGQGLIRYCTRKLNEVEKKVELLVRKDCELATEPFSEGVPAPEAGEGDAGGGLPF